MLIEAPVQTSVFDQAKIHDLYEEIRDVYRRFPQPWVIGYSGGKDSTATLQAVWKALEGLAPEERTKPIFVIASDTKVETPIIVDYIDRTLQLVNEQAQAAQMPFFAHKVMPTLNDSFWVNLIGRGYPAPTTRFRWCTDRLKINPANRFVEEKVARYGEVIMVLGVRKTESATRMQLMNSYQVKGHVLRRHSTLRGAYVYAPIADFTTDDVWTYLLQVESPWGGSNRDLSALYRSASSGECPLVIDTSTPSCGSSRFGCWVCTVAQKDSSMEALVDNGEEWLEPLLELRAWLGETIDPARKVEFRDYKGRDGRVLKKKDGTLASRTYKLETSKLTLQKLLRAQEAVRRDGPNAGTVLISEEELLEIRRLWRTERQDWEDAVPQIYRAITGRELACPTNDDGGFDAQQQALLQSACQEFDVPLELVTRLLEVERQAAGMARRAGIQKEIAGVFSQEWRTIDEITGAVRRGQEQLMLEGMTTTAEDTAHATA